MAETLSSLADLKTSAVAPASTMRPSSITQTEVAMRCTMPRSWVMNSTARP